MIPHPITHVACLLGLSGIMTLSGCGAGAVPELADVSGTVKLGGKPLAGATVMFIPTNGRPSTGKTDNSGYYEMTYNDSASGVVPGQCRVLVSTATPATENADGETVPGQPETVPIEYNVESELTFDVKSGTDNVANFELRGGGPVASVTGGEDDAPGSSRAEAYSE